MSAKSDLLRDIDSVPPERDNFTWIEMNMRFGDEDIQPTPFSQLKPLRKFIDELFDEDLVNIKNPSIRCVSYTIHANYAMQGGEQTCIHQNAVEKERKKAAKDNTP